MKEWAMVLEVQRRNPGWRFMLLGGDKSMGYRTNKDGSLKRRKGRLIVAPESRFPFGWKAEFFGHEDPRVCTGQRHAEVYANTPEDAIRQLCAPFLEGK